MQMSPGSNDERFLPCSMLVLRLCVVQQLQRTGSGLCLFMAWLYPLALQSAAHFNCSFLPLVFVSSFIYIQWSEDGFSLLFFFS